AIPHSWWSSSIRKSIARQWDIRGAAIIVRNRSDPNKKSGKDRPPIGKISASTARITDVARAPRAARADGSTFPGRRVMFGVFGLGLQEIIILAVGGCGFLVVVVAVVALVLLLTRGEKSRYKED